MKTFMLNRHYTAPAGGSKPFPMTISPLLGLTVVRGDDPEFAQPAAGVEGAGEGVAGECSQTLQMAISFMESAIS